MFYIGIKIPHFRKTVIAVLLLIAVALIYATSEHGAVKSCYSDSDGRISYLKTCSLEVEEDFISDTVTIPQVFSDVYESYNELQKKQGFDLSLFKGCKVTRYTYTVKNYPSSEVVLAHLLVYEDVIIGGDIMSTSINGFMKTLKGE